MLNLIFPTILMEYVLPGIKILGSIGPQYFSNNIKRIHVNGAGKGCWCTG